MALDAKIVGSTSGTGVEVNAANQLKVVPETNASANPGNVGTIRSFSENDSGAILTTPQLMSPETDLDYRLRVGLDTYLDQEVFNYAAQNTGKFQFNNTTMTAVWGVSGMQFNSGSIVTTTTNAALLSRASFPITGTSTLSADVILSFSSTPVSNVVAEFGFYLPNAAAPYNPTDGVHFRLTAAGLVGVVNYNGVENSSGVMAFTIVPNQKYQFIVYVHQRTTEFWINNGVSTDLYAVIQTPVANSQPCASAALPFAARLAIVGGAAGGVMQMLLGSVNVRLGGPNITRTIGEMGNGCYGSYQGLSGGAMGSLAAYLNSANPTAAIPSNTSAALGTGLGGQFWETDTLAVTTDGIICSHQVPAGSVSVPGRRLRVTGVRVDSFVQTALTGGGYVAQWSLAFGHTAVAMTTAEAATTKAPRRLPVGIQAVAAAAAAGVVLSPIDVLLGDAPIYVNPGEFVALAKKKVGVAPTGGVIGHLVTFKYSWE